jgi:hypothetical protein
MEDPSDVMWNKIRELFVTQKQKYSDLLQERLEGTLITYLI